MEMDPSSSREGERKRERERERERHVFHQMVSGAVHLDTVSKRQMQSLQEVAKNTHRGHKDKRAT